MNKIKLILADGTEATNDDIDILIGADLYWKLVTGKTHLLPGGPMAVETIFGWVLSGELNENGCNPTSTVMLSSASPTMEEAYQKLQRIIDIESLEYLGQSTVLPHQHPALFQFDNSVTFNRNRYQVELS